MLLAGLVLALPANARHRHAEVDTTPGQFDYYLLSLSWSPAYCLESPTSAQCNGSRAYDFIVHGLWPQDEHGWPERCSSERVPDSVATSMLDLMPARGLIFHEWSTHGTCSGLEPAQYFQLLRGARERIAVPPGFGHGSAAIEQPPASVAAAFLRAPTLLIPPVR